ncbi:MAG: isoprenylcysteine carboxylmethyltransferase family protein [Pseudomonadota bacterium]
MHQLARQALRGYAQLMLGMAVFLFAPGWTFDFWQAWLYLLVFGTASALISFYLWKKDPQLLQRRVRGGPRGEKQKSQQRILSLASIAFAGLMMLPALDHRFSWSRVPLALVLLGEALVLAGFLVVFAVFRENSFASATVELAPGHKVITTGPYAIVRHPMYTGGLVLLLGTPLALGSWWGLLMFLPLLGAVLWRLLEEEKFLSASLPGYAQYRQTVRYRLLPFIW